MIDKMGKPLTLLGRCRRLGHCGYIDCICDVDPTDPRDMANLRGEENMSELESIIGDVENQASHRQQGCLSMRSERLLVTEIRALRTKAEYWRLIAERMGREIIDDNHSFVISLQEQINAAREFVKRHPSLSLIDLAEFEAFLKISELLQNDREK